jgi:hypothetical protein
MPFPAIISAQEITGSGSIIVAIAAEWMISSTGLGYVINNAMQNYRGDRVYAVALLATGLVLSDIYLRPLARRPARLARGRSADTERWRLMAAGLSAEAQAMPASIPVVDIGGALRATIRPPRRRSRPGSARLATTSASSTS